MAHSDLLERINTEVSNCLGLYAGATLGSALNEVLKVHEPDESNWCGSCFEVDGDDALRVEYPCETIQAIWKGLDA